MPELPEVETVRRSIEGIAVGRLLTGVDVSRPDLRYPIPQKALKSCVGSRIDAINRRGKVLLLHLSGQTILIHLGMSGRLLAGQENTPRHTHEHTRFTLDDGTVLRFICPRRFGYIEVGEGLTLETHPRLKNLGIEPLSGELTGDLLFRISRKRRVAIRNLLLDGRLIAGVGNIYANEACFHAGVRPQRKAERITQSEAGSLAVAIQSVLTRAIEAGGTTLADGGYVDGAGREGWFQVDLAVYGRDGEPCHTCETSVIRKMIGQRSAFYCPTCQK